MPLNKPDILQHTNPLNAIVDSNFTRGGIRSAVNTLTELYQIGSGANDKVDQLKQHSTRVYVSGEGEFYILKDLSNRTNVSGWQSESNILGKNIVYTTGDQIISGFKSFRDGFYLNNTNNEEYGGTLLEGNTSGISLKTEAHPTDIKIRSNFVGGYNEEVISIGNSFYTDTIFGPSINTAEFGDQIVIYQTGSSFAVFQSKGPYIRLGKNNIISEKSTSKLGIGTLFPTEKVHISGGNLKVEGNILANQFLDTTYSNLTGLKATSGLLSGQLYRISDFILFWNNQSINDATLKIAASGEPLIVTAISKNKISHIARSEIYPQDTIYYDIDASGSYSWGTINNTAAIPNFKGWIYRRVDNLLNIDIPYDWRNITVNCCKVDVSSIPDYSGNYQYDLLDVVKSTGNNINRGKLYYSLITGNIGQSIIDDTKWAPVSAYNESGTYFATNEANPFATLRKESEGLDKVDLPYLSNTRIQQPTFTSILTGLGTFTLNTVRNIKIVGGHSNVFVGEYFYDNNIGNGFAFNTIGSNFNFNNIGNMFQDNKIGYFVGYNHIGNNCYVNVFGNSFLYNTIENNFQYNNIGPVVNYNSIANNFYYNNIGTNFSTNVIGPGFLGNTIGIFFYYNTIGPNCYSNIIGRSFESNTIGNSFQYNIIGRYAQSNNIGNVVNFNLIGNDFLQNTLLNNINNTIFGNNFQLNTIESFITFTNFLSSTHVYNSYNTTIFRNSAETKRLRYFNSNDQLVVTDPTA